MVIRLRINKSNWGAGEPSYRTITVHTPIISSEAKSLLRTLAKDWGDINRQITLFTSDRKVVMGFSCEGHGGLGLFSKDPLPFLGEADLSSFNYGSLYHGQDEWYVYLFEEDEQWAILYSILPEFSRKKLAKFYNNDLISLDQAAKKEVKSLSPEFIEGIEKNKSFFVLETL